MNKLNIYDSKSIKLKNLSRKYAPLLDAGSTQIFYKCNNNDILIYQLDLSNYMITKIIIDKNKNVSYYPFLESQKDFEIGNDMKEYISKLIPLLEENFEDNTLLYTSSSKREIDKWFIITPLTEISYEEELENVNISAKQIKDLF